MLSSQTIGVEFSSKIIKVGTGAKRKRIKLQLWDTAGTERFRSVSRSYYRGAAGAILVYDIASRQSFTSLSTFLNDARALASPNLTLLLAGNKLDLASGIAEGNQTPDLLPPTPSSTNSRQSTLFSESNRWEIGSRGNPGYSSTGYGIGTQKKVTRSSEGREVTQEEASRWASTSAIPVSVEVSAYTGSGVEELFARLARIILTKIELGEIDPDDPMSGIQYGDTRGWVGDGDGGSVRSGNTTIEGGGLGRRRRKRQGTMTGLREWEAVFRLDTRGRRRSSGCC